MSTFDVPHREPSMISTAKNLPGQRQAAALTPMRRVLCGVLGAVVLAAAGGCTTTTHVTEARTSPLNRSPSTMSELRIAEVALDAGNTEMAKTVFERVVKTDPNSVPGLTGLGNTLYSVGDFTRAGVYFEQASRISPDDPTPLLGIARVAIRQHRFDDAIAACRKVLQKTPDDALAMSALGVALDMKGEHAGAQAVLRQGLVSHPGDPLLSINLGLSLVLGGDPRQGANVLLDVTRYPSAPAQARQDLALAYGLMGNSQAAAAILSQDLPPASVQDNLRFYEIQRARMAQRSSSASTVQTGAVQ
ncbi:MAG: tetratricopeptide repeat protein [Janthinobacterium lividum]